MSENAKLQMNDDMLGVVDSWLGGTDDNASGTNQPVFEKRPQRLGLGAKYVPQKKEETTNSLLKKKLNREKRRKKERDLENRDISSESESDEELQSRAKAIKSKVIQKAKVTQIVNRQKTSQLNKKRK